MRFVSVEKYGFVVEPRYYFFGWSNSPKVMGRYSAVRKLVSARKYLPKGYNFKIWDCQRPRFVQIAMVRSFKRRLKVAHPKVSVHELNKLVELFGGPLNPPLRLKRLDTHRNGGSFDLTIVDCGGNELCMGTDHDDLTSKAALDYFEKRKKLVLIEREAKKNRRLLKGVMRRAGFKEYAPEWWHWSYGK